MNITLGIGITTQPVKAGSSPVNLGFDPADTGAGITLSNDNKTATCSVSLSSVSTQSITSHTSSDMRYLEMVVDVLNIADFRPGISDDVVTGLPSVGNSFAYLPSGSVNQGSIGVKTLTSYTVGAILQFWLKPSTGQYWVGNDGVVDGSPSTETSPTGTLTPATFKAALGPRRLNNAGTIRTTPAEFTYSAQGALGWDE